MRTPELADAEKLAIANVERAWQHNNGKGLGHGKAVGELGPQLRSRGRKGKPGQKKLPQRGLGVAQLEKLRLQEQSKQEAACLASLQTLPPSMGFADQNQSAGAMYLRHIKGAISHHANARITTPLAFGSGRLGPPDKLAEYLARGHVGKGGAMDGDHVFRMSLVSRASHAFGAKMGGDEKRSSAEMDMSDESVGFSQAAPSKGVGEINATLLPVIVTGGAPGFSLTNLQCFESSSGPAIVDRLPREISTNVPVVVGGTAKCDKSKELSSVQNFSSNHSWSALHSKALHESTCKPLHSNRLDLNALAGESTYAADKDRGNAGVAQPGQQSAVESRHSDQGLIRTAPEDCSTRPLKIRLCGTWDETRSSETAVGFYSDESLLKGRTNESKRKESCSSVFPPSSLTLNRRRSCLSSPEMNQLLTAGSDRQKSTGDFLTLGLSSYSPSAHHENELNSQEAMTPEGTRQVDNMRSKGGHDGLQFHLCNPPQAQVQQMGSYPFVADECINGEARLSYRFSSLSSGSLTEQCHRQTERTMEESLDLRLKLAL